MATAASETRQLLVFPHLENQCGPSVTVQKLTADQLEGKKNTLHAKQRDINFNPLNQWCAKMHVKVSQTHLSLARLCVDVDGLSVWRSALGGNERRWSNWIRESKAIQLGDTVVKTSLATVDAGFLGGFVSYFCECDAQKKESKKQGEFQFWVNSRLFSSFPPLSVVFCAYRCRLCFEICFGTAEPSRVVLILTLQMECVRNLLPSNAHIHLGKRQEKTEREWPIPSLKWKKKGREVNGGEIFRLSD